MKTNADHNAFMLYDKLRFILAYIDDHLIIRDDLIIINGLKNKLSDQFCIKVLGSVFHY